MEKPTNRIAFSLESCGMDGLLLESRGSQLDARDVDFIKREKASMRIGSIKIGHDDPAKRPELWLPDQIIGALGDYLTRHGNTKYSARKPGRNANRNVELEKTTPTPLSPPRAEQRDPRARTCLYDLAGSVSVNCRTASTPNHPSLTDGGDWLIFHAATPPSDKTFRELGIERW